MDGLEMLKSISSQTVDLILTDPPYIISRESGMNKVFTGEATSKYGTKYAIQTNYGKWDSSFTMEKMAEFVYEFSRVLKKGGSCIIFFDVWKIESLMALLTQRKFSKLRLIEWIKTNPVPINSKATYLNNCREVAISAVKGAGQTFHSSYDNGLYFYPIYQGQRGIDRIHPTQKSLDLFSELIEKHSNENDVVVDTFGGSGTTYIASMKTNRRCFSSEADVDYFYKAQKRIKWHKNNLTSKQKCQTFFEEEKL